MSRIRSKHTEPERRLRMALVSRGTRGWRMHARGLPGTPDFAFDAVRIAVFLDGAFWHGRAGIPKARRAWWRAKFRRNRSRDLAVDEALRGKGWIVVRLDAAAVVRDPAQSAGRVAWLAWLMTAEESD
jgi:DNA mismatch endonuclease (patch repair protein)